MLALSLSPVAASSLPPPDEAVAAAAQLLDSVAQWRPAGVYGGIRTYTTSVDGTFWAARSSEHAGGRAVFDSLAWCLGAVRPGSQPSPCGHTEHEAEYMHIVRRWEPVPGAAAGWDHVQVEYALGWPLSPRVFDVAVCVVPDWDSLELYVVSVCVDGTAAAGFVRGRYTLVERVRLVGERVEWTMCTCSDAGGRLPGWLQRLQIPRTIAKDVGAVWAWTEA